MNPRLLAVCVLCLSVWACTVREHTGRPARPNPNLGFTESQVAGLALELIDPKAAESMTFTRYGTVMATVGLKNGPVAAPAYCWYLDSGRLRLTHDLEQRYLHDEFTLVSRDGGTLTVRRNNGKIAKYKILRK